jgi:hypothetical protein
MPNTQRREQSRSRLAQTGNDLATLEHLSVGLERKAAKLAGDCGDRNGMAPARAGAR